MDSDSEHEHQSKIEAMEAFERRYPIAGETVHSLVKTYGGIEAFLESLEKHGFGGELFGWLTARRPGTMRVQEIRELIDHDRIEQVSKETGHDLESVEMQLSQYLPRLFMTMGESLDGMEFLWSSHSSHSTRTGPPQHDVTQ